MVLLLSLVATIPAYASDTITIASFNIQVFGKTKASKTDVMSILANTISRFDIVAIQEIRDKSGTAIKKLEEAIDATGSDYTVIIGPRLGRSSSKEQYAFIYRTETVEPIGNLYTYPEPNGTDPFYREPFIGEFKAKSGNFDFILITVHTDPDEATEEIRALNNVLIQAKTHYPKEDDFIILGNLNADCDYYKESQHNPIIGTTWLIPNTADTTVKDTVCTYDRIIITNQVVEDYTGIAKVFRFDEKYHMSPEMAAKVSDHYPVYAVFFSGNVPSSPLPTIGKYMGNVKSGERDSQIERTR
jgi:endonuclease/exonuclease/phosphatase family metal-dependent hydrolase